MSSTQPPLNPVEPRPLSEPGMGEPTPGPPPIALQLGPESQIPDHPGSMVDVPRPANNYASASAPLATSTLPTAGDAKQLRTQCQFALREYQALLRRRATEHGGAMSTSSLDLEARLKGQQNSVLVGLRDLQDEVRGIGKDARNHRWRTWLLGGAVASFIPLVRRIFRRGSDRESDESSNDTEYAFRRSKGLLSHMRDAVLGRGGFARIAFFVFAVLYVFQNEVTLQVAKTMHKRIRRLTERVERGDPDIDDKDMRVLEGWRWRVLFW